MEGSAPHTAAVAINVVLLPSSGLIEVQHVRGSWTGHDESALRGEKNGRSLLSGLWNIASLAWWFGCPLKQGQVAALFLMGKHKLHFTTLSYLCYQPIVLNNPEREPWIHLDITEESDGSLFLLLPDWWPCNPWGTPWVKWHQRPQGSRRRTSAEWGLNGGSVWKGPLTLS